MEEAILAKIKADIKEAEKRLDVMKEDITRAERAGIDVKDLKVKYRDLVSKIELMRVVYVG